MARKARRRAVVMDNGVLAVSSFCPASSGWQGSGSLFGSAPDTGSELASGRGGRTLAR